MKEQKGDRKDKVEEVAYGEGRRGSRWGSRGRLKGKMQENGVRKEKEKRKGEEGRDGEKG